MYCTTCGKQIIDTARFCNFCGSPVAGAPFTAPAAPVNPTPVTAPAAPSSPIENTPVSAPVESTTVFASVSEQSQSVDNSESLLENKETVPEIEAASALTDLPSSDEQTSVSNENESLTQAQSDNTQAVAYTDAAAAEMPSRAPVPDIQAGSAYSLPAPSQIPVNGESNVHAAPVPEKPAKPLPERKYTLGHIMMCLGAVAVMAIVAGVFAGLYFSVV